MMEEDAVHTNQGLYGEDDHMQSTCCDSTVKSAIETTQGTK